MTDPTSQQPAAVTYQALTPEEKGRLRAAFASNTQAPNGSQDIVEAISSILASRVSHETEDAPALAQVYATESLSMFHGAGEAIFIDKTLEQVLDFARYLDQEVLKREITQHLGTVQDNATAPANRGRNIIDQIPATFMRACIIYARAFLRYMIAAERSIKVDYTLDYARSFLLRFAEFPVVFRLLVEKRGDLTIFMILLNKSLKESALAMTSVLLLDGHR